MPEEEYYDFGDLRELEGVNTWRDVPRWFAWFANHHPEEVPEEKQEEFFKICDRLGPSG